MPSQDEDFVQWCLENKELLQLLGKEEPFTFEELKEARSKIWARNGDMSGYLFADMAELWARRENVNRDESRMYEPIANALGGEILGAPGQPDCLVNGVPVEAKNEAFTSSAMKQLRRYMKNKGASRGIAAAPSFSIPQAEDVFFLQVTYSRNESAYIVKNATEALQWLKQQVAFDKAPTFE